MSVDKCIICGKVIVDGYNFILKNENGEVIKGKICDECALMFKMETRVYQTKVKEGEKKDKYFKVVRNIRIDKLEGKNIYKAFIVLLLK